jgi:DNA-directed RNA polymerase subunit K/omega
MGMDAVVHGRLLEKVWGKYHLATLLQKRMRELISGSPPMVPAPDPGDLWDIVAREILNDKVNLLTGEEADKLRKELAAREAESAQASNGKGKAKEGKTAAEEPAAPKEA